MDKGWISLHRKIKDHWIWQEKKTFSNLEAWLDILLTVNHSDKKVLIKTTLFEVKRGESILSLDSWAKRWNWNKSKVRRFLILLQNDNMIVANNEQKTTRITVLKYDSYQTFGNDNETIVKQKRNTNETRMTPNNNVNNKNNVNNENKKEINKENFLEICLNDKPWIEVLCMQFKITEFQVIEKLKYFDLHLKTQKQTKSNHNDYAKHFSSWLNLNRPVELPKRSKVVF